MSDRAGVRSLRLERAQEAWAQWWWIVGLIQALWKREDGEEGVEEVVGVGGRGGEARRWGMFRSWDHGLLIDLVTCNALVYYLNLGGSR